MVLLIVAVILGLGFLVWLWKVPVKKMVEAMKESGSSSLEAYLVVLLLVGALTAAIYMITAVV